MEAKTSFKHQSCLGTALILFFLILAPSTPAAAQSPKQFGPEVAKLVGGPRHYTPIYTKALRLRAAIRHGDFRTAEKMLKTNLKRSRIGMFHFHPFPALVEDATPAGDTTYLKRLNAWIARDPKLAVAYILRAEYEFDTGWAIRGTRFNDEVQAKHADSFAAELAAAGADIDRAIRLDASNPFARFLQLRVLKAAGSQAELDSAFRGSIRRFPNYYPLYRVRLSALEPKWGGTPQAIYAYLAAYAQPAPRYSPLKMLYMQAYREFLDTAWIDCMRYRGDTRTRCTVAVMDHLATDDLEKKAYSVLALYHHTDHQYAFIDALEANLHDMVDTTGGERYSGAFLQLAADRLDTDNELVPDHTGTNVYMIDDLTGDVWYRQNRFDNAGKMYRRAIKDLPHTRFPNREARDRALSHLYTDLAGVYDRQSIHQYDKAIAYLRAANILLGDPTPGYGREICGDLVLSKHYRVMLRDCPVALQPGGDARIAYWRARAYRALGKKAQAIRYYRFVANSEDSWRSDAVIDMELLYPDNKKGWQHQLDILNAYPYLYNPAEDGKRSTAIAYNNRCYAKMHLGMLEAALKDCTASLRYGNLPDAFQKQRKIIQRLRAQGKM